MRPKSPPPQKSSSWFNSLARWTAHTMGKSAAFVIATSLVVAWIATGPIFHYSDTWQLVINTATTIVTFLMVFLIQHTQNRDAQAMDVKLSEIIRAVKGARNRLANLDDMTDEELKQIHDYYVEVAERAKRHSHNRQARAVAANGKTHEKKSA